MTLSRFKRILTLLTALALVIGVPAAFAESASAVQYPLTIAHAYGETVLEKKPERVVAISWGNLDVPLALGVVPVGVSKANYGVGENEDLLPWTVEGFAALGVSEPAVFDDTDGLDYEAINDAQPDVILAAYSGITREEYDMLSQIAPVIAYPTEAWQTTWREMIVTDAAGMGMEAEGEALVASLDALIAGKVSAYPALEGKTAAFFYIAPTDFGSVYIYTLADPRAAYLTDLGLGFPQSVTDLIADENSFAVQVSAENLDGLTDLDIIITYGDDGLLAAMQADPLLGSVPAVQNGAVVVIENGSYLSASCTPSALSIPATIDEYLAMIASAAEKVK